MSVDRGAGRSGMRAVFTARRITVLVVAVLALVFIFENTHQIRIRVIVPEVTMRLWLALLLTFLAGCVCGLFTRWGVRRGGRR